MRVVMSLMPALIAKLLSRITHNGSSVRRVVVPQEVMLSVQLPILVQLLLCRKLRVGRNVFRKKKGDERGSGLN